MGKINKKVPLRKDNQRQIDLLRCMRSGLLDEGLITRDEYTGLLIEKDNPGAVKRLNDYDELITDVDRIKRMVISVGPSLLELQAVLDFLSVTLNEEVDKGEDGD